MPTPTCPSCGYDLSGLLEPGGSCTCPECSTKTTYETATTRKPPTPTVKIATIYILAIPSSWAVFSMALLFFGPRLSYSQLPFLLIPVFIAGIPILSTILLVLDRKSRKRCSAALFEHEYSGIIMFILTCTVISEALLLFGLYFWIGVISNA